MPSLFAAILLMQSELSSVFLGQWENGMVPSVRYAPGYSGDFLGGSLMLGPGGWNQNGTPPKAASGANTSGLAALPLHAEAALRIFNLSPRSVVLAGQGVPMRVSSSIRDTRR